MNHAFGQPGFEQPRRGNRAGRRHNADPGPLLDDALHQRQYRSGFADTGGMEPDERSRRTPHPGYAEPLADARSVFLAAVLAALEKKPNKRGQRGGQCSI